MHKRLFNMVLRASAIHAKALQKLFQGSKANCCKRPRVSGCCRSGTAEVRQKRSRPRNGASAPRCCINASARTEPHWAAAGSGQEGAHFAVQGGTGYMCVTFFIWDAGLVQRNPPRNIS